MVSTSWSNLFPIGAPLGNKLLTQVFGDTVTSNCNPYHSKSSVSYIVIVYIISNDSIVQFQFCPHHLFLSGLPVTCHLILWRCEVLSERVSSGSNSCFHGKLTDWSKSSISKSLHFFATLFIYLFIVNYYLLLQLAIWCTDFSIIFRRLTLQF